MTVGGRPGRGYPRGRRGQQQLVIYGRPEGGLSDLFYGIGVMFRSGWRYRSELAPVYAYLTALVAGGWLHSRHPRWWPVVAGIGLCATAGLLVWEWLPRRITARLQVVARRPVRLWATVFMFVSSAWLTTATITGPGAGPLNGLAMLATAGLGVPWWKSKARRAKVRVRRVMERFADTAASAGLDGAEMVSAVVEPWGWTARVRLRRGQHARNAVDAVPALESALGTGIGAVTVEAVPTDAAQVVVRVVQTDPHAHPIPYPAVPGKRSRSITQTLTLGVWEDGSLVRVSVLRRHVLIGGTTGAGKSGLMNVIMAGLAQCGDVITWGVDLKEGMELTPWRPVLQRLATNPIAATRLLKAGVTELEQRAEYLTAKGEREWVPSASAPALVIVIDEYAELSADARRLADSIARRGRAVAVTVMLATQRPTQKAMGEGTAIRSQMDIRLCLRVRERGDVELILGAGALAAGWDTTSFDAPGKFLVSAPGLTTARRARAYWINDKEITHTAGHNARPIDQPIDTPVDRPSRGHRRPQDSTSHIPEGGAGQTTPDAAQGPSRAGQDRAATTASATEKGDQPTAQDVALRQALLTAPPQGRSRAQLRELSGMSNRTLTRRLNSALAAGVVDQVSRGNWRATNRM